MEYTKQDVQNVNTLIESHARRVITEAGLELSEEVLELLEEEIYELSSVELDSCIYSPKQCLHYGQSVANKVIAQLK